MDKFKTIKILVFMLTFLMVFVLCLLINRVFVKKSTKPFEITLATKGENFDFFKVEGDYVYVYNANKIHIVDAKKGVYKGLISTTGEQ